MSQALLKPIKLHDLELNNRVIMAPMTRSRADNRDNAPNEMMVTYYTQRAGAGLIISEGSQISKQAVGYINTPGIYSKEQVTDWKKVTDAVHQEGGKIFIQLWHVGRMSHPDFHNGEFPVAPSAINPESKSFTPEGFKDTVTPRALTIPEIKQIIQDYKAAAANAMEAGFDGVEIHASNGYLLHQFFASTSNIRNDEYGGSKENRARILFEVIDAIKEVVPAERIGVRLNPSLHNTFGMTLNEDTIPTFDYIIENLNKYKLAYLHLTEASPANKDVPHIEPNIAKRYRPVYKGNLIINGGFTQESGNNVIEEGAADMVAYGVPFIANPDLPARFEQDAELQEADSKTFYVPGAKGYIDYPSLAEVEA
ncbi:N-ethylmaleimide reductase [Pontibacter aydingkolensis]|uniref:Alkene reductase n=1 Tax=Pontibacter aydingkolensis TaxID=1911536 RepID=A0ABS7CSY2_9BACT|nr:alkene reductase [Pontibacter aydingkolensis]MBW7466957.1 alkene reductase [Pontibacter aydingkolensis]